MFENKTKGWHGSYSVIGKISAEKFHIILKKNQILKEKKRKKKVNLFLFPSDSFDKKDKKKQEEKDVNIFDNFTKSEKNLLKKEREEKKLNKRINIDNYKFHNFHHEDIEKQIRKMKEHEKLYVSTMKYIPKMEYIWKKVISGPKWNTLSGREKKIINYKSITIGTDENNKLNKKNFLIKNLKNNFKISKKNNKVKNDNLIFNTHIKTINMDKQTARGDLPIHHDNRIRNVKPFITKKLKKIYSKENMIKSSINKNTLRLSLSSNNNIYNNNSKELMHSNSTKIFTSYKIKKNQLIKPNYSGDIKTIDFSKTISREQFNFINRDKEGVQPFFLPNYELVEPRSLSMVYYSKSITKPINLGRLKGVDPNLFFDPNKVINKYNNHIETNAPNFNIMSGRIMDKSPFPTYMIKKFDRCSLEAITEKGLRMNSYLNSRFDNKFTTFYPKKSFNRLINNNCLQNEKFPENCINYLVKECFKDEKLRKAIEYYNKDVNYYLEQNNLKRNFDGVTFNTYKYHAKKYKDKEFYEKCFDDKYNGFA